MERLEPIGEHIPPADKEAQEAWIQAYAKYLEEVREITFLRMGSRLVLNAPCSFVMKIKASNPEEYKKIVESLLPPTAQGVKLPGGDKILSSDGAAIKSSGVNEEGVEVTPVSS